MGRRAQLSRLLAGSKNAGLTADEAKQLKGRLEREFDKEPPPVLVLIGEAGVGKSTTINALFNAGQPIGHAAPTTMVAQGFDVKTDHLVGSSGGLITVYDMPGLGDDLRTYESYRSLYVEVLSRADVILWVHPTAQRMVAFMQNVMQDLFNNELRSHTSRLVIGLNKVDEAGGGVWNPAANVPADGQLATAEEREHLVKKSIQYAIPKWSGNVVAYSALKRYRLPRLFKALMHAVPEQRRWVLEDRMDLADFLELVDRGMLEAAPTDSVIPQATYVDIESPVDPPHEAAPPAPSPPSVEERLRQMDPKEYSELVQDPAKLAAWFEAQSQDEGVDR